MELRRNLALPAGLLYGAHAMQTFTTPGARALP